MTARLPTRLWLDALIRRADLAGASAFVTGKGDAERGDVIVKVSALNGLAVAFAPYASPDGTRMFAPLAGLEALGPAFAEADIDAAIARRRSYDEDLWVIEIEDREGRSFLTEPVRLTGSG